MKALTLVNLYLTAHIGGVYLAAHMPLDALRCLLNCGVR